jgi:hypothetical protein
LEQDIKNPAISLAYYFLKYCLKNFKVEIEEPKIHTTLPPEKDAELSAWRITRQVLDASEVDSYVDDKAHTGTKQEIFQDLLNCGPNEEYDVSNSTSSFIRKYKPQFECFLNLGPDCYQRFNSLPKASI